MKSKRYMGVDLHRNCFTVYTRQEDGNGETGASILLSAIGKIEDFPNFALAKT